ncbi:hypothetical protein AB0B04_18900 [Streptomyces xinghaiensis]|uniref:Uncharacterized protein n=2 Tax=Streptomyces TaxID=1883 RepID=A0A420UY01_9ACTN|nr:MULTISPECIES: hypothetical protein [Streptomyces]KNE78793.1 hypothetical protein ADZ36_31270 [Streptomyces fradiae]OFA36652.1 hypothetical protein BEN35_29795 [Streptomyces fradiae]PQM20649.1 hypothetical protein Sfr7A_26045 [Streptomyces xinghaiensis]RKM92589.1 hypothetical protein SFRA_024700 [Streptomyces xinghaiensis]RNC70557.1 hypothetical protein DC095_025690 [Streptomyces xinghaiensis]
MPATTAVYACAHLDDLTLRQARRALRTARYWWQEASAPLSYYRPSQCRAWARRALADAARLRRQLAALRALPGRYVNREQWAQITARAADH